MLSAGPFARRTEHPYRAARLEDLPPGLQQLAGQALPPDDAAATIFVVPPQILPKKFGGLGGMRSVPAQALLFTAGGVLHVQEAGSPGQPGQAVYLRGENLLYAHLGMVLLYGRLELCAADDQALTHITVDYNTVGQQLMQPALHDLLRQAGRAWLPPAAGQDEAQTRLLQELGKQSFKFRSGLQDYVLQPGDDLLGYVLQPRLVRRYWGVFTRQALPPALLALTRSQLIVIEEGLTSATRYAWFITFCPRICVRGIQAKPNAAWQEMQIHLARSALSTVRRVRLEAQAAQDWQALWAEHAQ